MGTTGIVVLLVASLTASELLQVRGDDEDYPFELAEPIIPNYADTSSGRVQGQYMDLDIPYSENESLAFLGIPYARPPVGELRFKKPEPVEPWNGTLEAYTMPPACVQHAHHPSPYDDQEPGQSEDCLYLNVYVPVYYNYAGMYSIGYPRAIVFFIHGGKFLGGSNRIKWYHGESFAADGGAMADQEDITGPVVVTINYRLGAFGFLTTDTEDAPGNLGLHDMLLALEWVRENAAAFHGDPDRLTLYGHEAGAVAASLFCMSPVTEGMFSRAILHSGTFLSVEENRLEENVRLSNSLAEAVGCGVASPKEMVTCLQGIEAHQLAETLSSLETDALMPFYPQYGGELLPLDPVQAFKDGKFHDISLYVGVVAYQGGSIATSSCPSYYFAETYGEKYGRTWFYTFDLQNSGIPEAELLNRAGFNDAPYLMMQLLKGGGFYTKGYPYTVKQWTVQQFLMIYFKIFTGYGEATLIRDPIDWSVFSRNRHRHMRFEDADEFCWRKGGCDQPLTKSSIYDGDEKRCEDNREYYGFN